MRRRSGWGAAAPFPRPRRAEWHSGQKGRPAARTIQPISARSRSAKARGDSGQQSTNRCATLSATTPSARARFLAKLMGLPYVLFAFLAQPTRMNKPLQNVLCVPTGVFRPIIRHRAQPVQADTPIWICPLRPLAPIVPLERTLPRTASVTPALRVSTQRTKALCFAHHVRQAHTPTRLRQHCARHAQATGSQRTAKPSVFIVAVDR